MLLSKETLGQLTAEFKSPQGLQTAYSQILQHMINRSLEAEMQASWTTSATAYRDAGHRVDPDGPVRCDDLTRVNCTGDGCGAGVGACLADPSVGLDLSYRMVGWGRGEGAADRLTDPRMTLRSIAHDEYVGNFIAFRAQRRDGGVAFVA